MSGLSMEDEGRDKNGRDIYWKILTGTHNYYLGLKVLFFINLRKSIKVATVKYLEKFSHLFFTYFNIPLVI